MALSSGVGDTGGEQVVVRMAEIQGRGRALIAGKPLRAGQIVLRDSPILLYSARPWKNQNHLNRHCCYCSSCFRRILDPSTPSVVSCPSCGDTTTLFCSSNCRLAALTSSHAPWVCHSLIRLRDFPGWLLHPQERQLQAQFLVAAYNLAIVSPSHFRTLLSLQGAAPRSSSNDDDAAFFLHSLFSSLCPPPLPPPQSSTVTTALGSSFCLELTAVLLAKDKLNAFGLMEPFNEQDGGVERSVRAYGIYRNASFFNHDCLPNACRFDYIDAAAAAAASPAGECNTDIIVRMIHDVPEGREICLSYFPVNLNYRDRQQRLKEDYGFICSCDRCQVEANWSDEEEEEAEEGYKEEEVAMEEDVDEVMEAGSETENGSIKEESNFPHAYFFLRYMCSRENCWGTLAPLPPSNGSPSRVMECNVCGNLKNDEEEIERDACLG